jgi:hypothetical protein
MKHTLLNLVRALAVLLLVVPAPLALSNPSPAYAGMSEAAAAPAVEAPAPLPPDTTEPWTARFLAPAIVVIGVAVVIAAGAYYVVRIRGRYRVM